MKLAEWARLNGINRNTAYEWFHAGVLPVSAVQLPTGTILVESPLPGASRPTGVVVYARVSSSDQRHDLDRQAGRSALWATAQGLAVTAVITEVGSGLNGQRPKLARLLADASVATIVVEHRDRLAHFGVEHLEAALSAQGRRILVIDSAEVNDDLMRDMGEVLTSFCTRLYGRHSAQRRAAAAIAAAGAVAGADAGAVAGAVAGDAESSR